MESFYFLFHSLKKGKSRNVFKFLIEIISTTIKNVRTQLYGYSSSATARHEQTMPSLLHTNWMCTYNIYKLREVVYFVKRHSMQIAWNIQWFNSLDYRWHWLLMCWNIYIWNVMKRSIHVYGDNLVHNFNINSFNSLITISLWRTKFE